MENSNLRPDAVVCLREITRRGRKKPNRFEPHYVAHSSSYPKLHVQDCAPNVLCFYILSQLEGCLLFSFLHSNMILTGSTI